MAEWLMSAVMAAAAGAGAGCCALELLLGVNKMVTFRSEKWVGKEHAVYKTPACGGNASTTIRRSDFGMKHGIPSITDEGRPSTLFPGCKD